MVITTQALAAIWRNSPEATALHGAIMRDPVRFISAATVAEAAMLLLAERSGASDLELDALLRELGSTVLPLTEDHTHRAREAARTRGPGRHEAALSLGDCCAYALSSASGEPLLCAAGSALMLTDAERVIT